MRRKTVSALEYHRDPCPTLRRHSGTLAQARADYSPTMDQVGAARWWWRAVVPLLVVQILGAALIAVPSARALGLLVSVTAWIVMMVVIWRGVAVDRRQGVDRPQARTARNIGLSEQ